MGSICQLVYFPPEALLENRKWRKKGFFTTSYYILQAFKRLFYLIYIYLNGLGEYFTDTTDAPDLSRFRLVDMFTSCTDDDVKKKTGRGGRDGNINVIKCC